MERRHQAIFERERRALVAAELALRAVLVAAGGVAARTIGLEQGVRRPPRNMEGEEIPLSLGGGGALSGPSKEGENPRNSTQHA